MNHQKFSAVQQSFLQRRYGVNLGRRYVLAAASVVLLGVLGCSQVENSTKLDTKPRFPDLEPTLLKTSQS
ncbi:proteinase inhibitor I4 serpin [Cronbergia sp. UHCC 0137]|uniref:proteinase inhibitor I4 serpin n=1 Tax=Cronbergia sp. UHCC 0137 TaxID=3110239 RepID=UPI002B20C185|nr:proteinase inhibitor I4 serpin [Cronbergia sp. UHCC 0137]MEA5620861.1 proteinase inhibitor I4 serpin [Cronbergia sp. UHCC 0137]